MAHPEQREFIEDVKRIWPEWFHNVSVLEVGSLNINGTIRDFFTGGIHLGVDIAPGEGVDVVAFGENLQYPDRSFDVAISTECFEHNPNWVSTFANMCRMADKAVIFTCASSGRPEHGTISSHPGSSPFTAQLSDYYRNLDEQDFHREFKLDDMFSRYFFGVNRSSCDLYFWGLKGAVA